MSGKITKEQIPDKIKLLISENYPQDQAVAIALDMWRAIEGWIGEGMSEDDAIRRAVSEWEAALSDGRSLIRCSRAIALVDKLEGIIRAYVAIWGTPDERDSYNTWFDRQRPPEMDLDLLPIALRYEHGMDGAITYERIGEIYKIWFDEIGIAFEARLDKSSPYFERVVAEIQHGTPEGKLRTSSGTLNYIGDFYEDGAFKVWPVAEVSLTALPSEHRMPDVELVRSERGATPEASPPALPIQQGGNPGQGTTVNPLTIKDNREMNVMEILASLPADASLEDVMMALLNAGVTAEELKAAIEMLQPPEEAPASPEEAAASERAQFVEKLQAILDQRAHEELQEEARSTRNERDNLRRQNALLSARMAAPPQQGAPRGDATGGGNARISNMQDLRYDHLDAKQMALGYLLLRSQHKTHTDGYNRPVSEDYYQALRKKALEQVDRGYAGWKDPSNYRAARNAAYRANEIMGTGASQEGYDWIGTFYPSQLWEIARAGRIMSAVESAGLWVQEVPDGNSSAVVMLEGSDPTWYSAAVNSSVNAAGDSTPLVEATQATTANVTVTPGKAMVRILVATELIEDSIIPTLAQLNRQCEESAQNELESLFLNADSDTTASTNINLIDGTPASGTSAPDYLVTNGVLKYALVTGSSTSRDGTTFDSSDFLATQRLLPVANAADPEKLLFISDITTRLKALEFADVKTYSEKADGGTTQTGMLNMIYGVSYLASAKMALANTAGKISATAANNVKGRLAIVYPAYWAMVWKRQITFKTAEDIEDDVTKIVGSMRIAFQARGAGASAATYNLTVS